MGGSAVALAKRQKTGGSLSEAQALAWLEAKGQINTTSTELAHAWSWSRSKVKRLLVQWSTQGWIERQLSADRRFTRIVYRGSEQEEAPGLADRGSGNLPAAPPDKKPDIYRWFENVSPPVRTTGPWWPTSGPPKADERSTGGPPAKGSPPRQIISRGMAFLIGAALIVIGAGMGWVSMRINQDFGASLASSQQAAALWREGSLFADIFKMVSLVGASILWGAGRRGMAAALAVVWSLTLIYAVMAAAGFTSKNIADSTARRGSVADERERLTADIARLRTHLGWNTTIETPQRRSAAAVRVALQSAQPQVPAYTWRATSGCTDVTIEPSREACREVLSLRAELDEALRREGAEKELREKEGLLAKLPTVAAADPQAQAISRAVHWVSLGQATFGEGDVQLLRFLLLLLVFELPSALGMSAGIEIWRRAVFV